MKSFILPLFVFTSCVLFTQRIKAQVTHLNSYPSAGGTIFLDFDGEYVTGTSWNWSGPIDAQHADLSDSAIMEIFNRVAEDYRPFNINVTTDSTVYLTAPMKQRTRVIITSTSSWYGSSGGVSFVGSFAWGDDTPAWVFSTLLWNNVKNVAEACSHEAGHTLGLQHQSEYDANCRKTAEYSGGQGDGEIGWAPIMGVGYYKNLTTWHLGPSTVGCNSIQNDVEVIAGATNNVGLRADDYGNNPAEATDVSLSGPGFQVNGLINKQDDVDAFKMQIDAPTVFKLNAVPRNVGSGDNGANIDIKILLLNAASDTIGTYNPAMLLNAGIDTNLNSGAYYILVEGTGNINHSDYGSFGYYSLSGSVESTLPVHQFSLKGNNVNGNHNFSWTFNSDEPVKDLTVEVSSDGKDFRSLILLGAGAKTFSYQPLNSSLYYRVKAVTMMFERAYYSNIIHLLTMTEGRPVQLLSNIVHDEMIIDAKSAHLYQVYDAAGKLYYQGKLAIGVNHITIHNAPNGILFIRLTDAVDGWTEKLIKQ